MEIKPLPKTLPPSGWFYTGMNGFLNEIAARENDISKKYSNSQIELFYYYVGLSYKRAIWIKVKNINGIRIWFRVGFNNKYGKKVNVFSECKLDCLDWDYMKSYGLPDCFDDQGIWMTDKDRNLQLNSWEGIVNEVYSYLPNLFGASSMNKS